MVLDDYEIVNKKNLIIGKEIRWSTWHKDKKLFVTGVLDFPPYSLSNRKSITGLYFVDGERPRKVSFPIESSRNGHWIVLKPSFKGVLPRWF